MKLFKYNIVSTIYFREIHYVYENTNQNSNVFPPVKFYLENGFRSLSAARPLQNLGNSPVEPPGPGDKPCCHN